MTVTSYFKGFYQCSRNIRIDALERLRDKIPTILCDHEKIYPPAFFDVMVHLAIHLPDEALLRGLVQYGWMYPIERRLGTFKGYVRNRARPLQRPTLLQKH